MVRRADAKAQRGLTEVGGRFPSLDQSIEASGDAADAILVPRISEVLEATHQVRSNGHSRAAK